MRRPRALRLLVLLLLQAVLAAGLLEVGVRLGRQFSPGLRMLTYLPGVATKYDRITTTAELLATTNLGFAPGARIHGFRLNSRGFRTREYQTRRSEAVRVVAIGDSFTYGAVPYEQTWPLVLEQRLEQALGREVEVISLGVPSVGPEFYWRLWQLEASRLRPDLVVLGFFVGNDLGEHVGQAGAPSRILRVSYAARALRNGAAIAASLAASTRSAGDRDGTEAAGHESARSEWSYDPMRPTFREDFFYNMGWHRMRFCRQENRHRTLALVRNLRSFFAELDRAVADTDASLVVMLIPDEFQVDASVRQQLLERHDYPEERLRIALPQRRLTTLLDNHGIPSLDLLGAFQERATAARLYRPRDTHWNGAGNALAAELLSEYVVSSKLLE